MPELSLSLLGPLRVARAGATVTGFESDKVRALLAFLAVEAGRPHRRAALADLLWPERPERAALLNLNQALANLRKVLDDREAATPLILSARDQIQLNPAAELSLDVAQFTGLLAACAAHAHRSPERCPVCAGRRAEAVALYGGAFLEQLAPRDCLPFEEWALVLRERLERQLREALAALARFHELRDEPREALAYAARLVELDPLDEPAHRLVMALLWREGRRSEALAQYERCRATLAAELGAPPEDETERLRAQIMGVPQGDKGKASGAPPGRATAGSPHPPIPPSLHPPVPLTSFVGRGAELAQLADRLGDPACRLVSVVGLGGSGKTRLALEAAAAQVGAFADGVQTVSLAAVERPEELLPAIARAFGLAPGGAHDAQAQLIAHLLERELLLVLDNLEQLRAGATDLLALLEGAPRLTVLATSRERLGLRGEWVLDLGGLSVPEADTPAALEASGAGALFLEGARRARGVFEPDQAERRAIVRICTALGGHALAVELAVSWAHVLTCAEIEAELARGAGLLVGASQDLPARHRTLAAVLESSWALLTPVEQWALRRLAVFPASFGAEAAEAVLALPGGRPAALATLAGLINKALLRREPGGGYSAHALVREYALEQLHAQGEAPVAQGRLLGYVAALVAQAEGHLKTAGEAAWLDRLAAEEATVGAALGWALESGAATEAARLCAVLRWFWYIRGYIGAGRRWVERSVALARGGDVEPALLARLLQGAGVLADEDGDAAAAAAHYAESLALFRELGDRNGVRITTNSLGVLHNSQGRHAEARACFSEALGLSRELGQAFGAATSLNNLGTLAQALDDPSEARACFAEALAIARGIGYETLTTTVLDNLGDLALAEGDARAAMAAYGEALALQRGSGDTRGASLSLRGLGLAALREGDIKQAAPLLAESLALTRRGSGRGELAGAIDAQAALAVAQGRYELAARLLGSAAACREQLGAPAAGGERRLAETVAAAAMAAIGEGAFTLAWGAGRALRVERAAEELLGR